MINDIESPKLTLKNIEICSVCVPMYGSRAKSRHRASPKGKDGQNGIEKPSQHTLEVVIISSVVMIISVVISGAGGVVTITVVASVVVVVVVFVFPCPLPLPALPPLLNRPLPLTFKSPEWRMKRKKSKNEEREGRGDGAEGEKRARSG